MATTQKAGSKKGKAHLPPPKAEKQHIDPVQREAEKQEHNRRESDKLASEKAMQFAVHQMATPAVTAPELKAPEGALEAFNAELKALQEKHGVKVEPVKAKTKSEKVAQNGITRPGRETLCGKIWSAADEISATTGRPATVAEVKTKMHGTNDHTIKTQYARWRSFNGIKGRQVVPAPQEPQPAAS